MNIILFGSPGAGKGTQANNLVKDFKLYKISTGDLLRDEIKNSTVLGNKIKSIIDNGLLVSDNIINDLIKKVLADQKINNRLIFDGYPRNLNQAKELDLLMKKNNQKISCVISLNVDKESIVKRILGRQICSKCGLTFNEFFKATNKEVHKCGIEFLQRRSDDKESTIEARYETYLNQTMPIIDFYKDKNLLYEINGVGEILSIYTEIRAIISSLKG